MEIHTRNGYFSITTCHISKFLVFFSLKIPAFKFCIFFSQIFFIAKRILLKCTITVIAALFFCFYNYQNLFLRHVPSWCDWSWFSTVSFLFFPSAFFLFDAVWKWLLLHFSAQICQVGLPLFSFASFSFDV